MTKKTPGQRTFYLYYTKSYWVWKVKFDRFLAWKWVKIQLSNSITFFLSKIEGSLTTRFFCHSKLYFVSKFGSDRTNRKKIRNKRLLVPIQGKKLRFLKNFPWSRVLLDEWHLVIRFWEGFEKIHFFDIFWPPH